MVKNSLRVLGIMNGTSIDGVDLVLCRISKKPFKCALLEQLHFDFSRELQTQLRLAAKHELKVDALALLHHDLGRFYAEIVKWAVSSKKWKVDLIGVHGQTVFHAPSKATLQIGEPSYLRVEVGVPVVSDFRTLDFALGGQGAPIASLFHREVLAPLVAKKLKLPKKPIAIQNLGGIGNVTYVHEKKIFAFDTGPANMLIDLAMQTLTNGAQTYDLNGTFASEGIPAPGMASRWLSHPYFSKEPPKSCGREEFGEVFLQQALAELRGQSKQDIIATLTEFTAVSIAESYLKHLPKLPSAIVLCGGGAKNKYLISRIQFHIPSAAVLTSDDLGWPSDSIEGAAFALLAAYRVWNLPSNIPATTGAKKAASLGKVT